MSKIRTKFSGSTKVNVNNVNDPSITSKYPPIFLHVYISILLIYYHYFLSVVVLPSLWNLSSLARD